MPEGAARRPSSCCTKRGALGGTRIIGPAAGGTIEYKTLAAE
jgi:hypothetical protein